MANILSYFAYIINNFKEFIIISVVVTFGLMLYFNMVDAKYTRRKHGTNLYNMFLRIDLLSKIQIIFFYLSFLFITSLVVRFSPLSYLHIIAYMMLMICSILVSLNKFKLVGLNVLNSVITFVILQVLNILLNYLLNVYFNQYYLIIYVLISIALILYCLFILIYQISFVVTKRRVKCD